MVLDAYLSSLKAGLESLFSESVIEEGICASITPLPNPDCAYAYQIQIKLPTGVKDVFYSGVIPSSRFPDILSKTISITTSRSKLFPFFDSTSQTLSSESFKDRSILSSRNFNYLSIPYAGQSVDSIFNGSD